jgi:hypothetical protein
MWVFNRVCLLVFAWGLSAVPRPSFAADATMLIDRLRQTRATNIQTIIDAQFLHGAVAEGFRVADPYGPQAMEEVRRRNRNAAHGRKVCALRFQDAGRSDYELQNFESPEAASAAGFLVTHQGRCGSCSTLLDLAVYLATPDLTTPARQCARRAGLRRKKQCFQDELGLTPYCAESWAYNALNTRRECLGTCIADYGLVNLILNRYPGANTVESGQLRPCLQCDEQKSGAGFKYSAGRTRRNSGIESAIPRPDDEIYPVDHSAYFK